MNYQNEKAQPPTLYHPPSKTLLAALILLGIVFGLLILLGVITTIRVSHDNQNSSQEAISVGNSFIGNMGRHNYKASHSLLVPHLQATTQTKKLSDIEMLVEKSRGTFVSLGKPGWFVQDRGGQTTARLSYPVKFTQSNTTVSLMLIKTDIGYQVYNYDYNF